MKSAEESCSRDVILGIVEASELFNRGKAMEKIDELQGEALRATSFNRYGLFKDFLFNSTVTDLRNLFWALIGALVEEKHFNFGFLEKIYY